MFIGYQPFGKYCENLFNCSTVEWQEYKNLMDAIKPKYSTLKVLLLIIYIHFLRKIKIKNTKNS